MSALPQNVREAWDNRGGPIILATVNKDGVPNVIYVGMWFWEDDETLCVVNNYLNKTLANLNETGRVSFVCYGKNGSYQIKCKATEAKEGALYEKGKKVAQDGEKPYPGRSTVVCKVEEIYQGSGGKGAGDKLA